MIALIATHESRAIARIGDALTRYAPAGVEARRIDQVRRDTRASREIPGETDGDLVVLYCNGWRDRYQALADRCVARGQRYAVVQIALRTTRHPSTDQWRRLWSKAAVVWSYYPLRLWIEEDRGAAVDFNFYDAPLGVDASIFKPPADPAAPRPFIVCTSGFRRNQEGVGECDEAAAALGEQVFQLGPTFAMKARTTFMVGIDDAALAAMYGKCRFSSGLRRHEGFELPAAEGLLCGARPLLFDRPHYLRWFQPWGVFVSERGEREVADALRHVFDLGPRPVTLEERAAAARLFDWERICRGFWEACSA